MKRSLFTVAVLLLSSSAFASKARLGALQGAFDITDTQTVFDTPGHIHLLNPYMTFEMGSASGTPKAEGGFMMKNDDARWGAYFGHIDGEQTILRKVGTYQNMQNPIDLFYGQGAWAVGLSLSSSEDASTDEKQSTAILRYGYSADGMDFGVSAAALASAQKVDDKYTGSPVLGLYFTKAVEKVAYLARLNYGDTKQDVTAVSNKVKTMTAELGVLHRPVAELYYGVSYLTSSLDVEGAKKETTSLPFVIGLEKDVWSWMTLRASLKQNFLLGSVKDDITPTKEKKNLNDTSVAVGVGVKHENFTLDGLLAGSTTGKVNGSDLLTQASITYNF